MQIAGVWVTTVRTDDVESSVQWYRDVLGLWPPDEDDGTGAALEAGDHRLVFDPDADADVVLSLQVADVNTAVEELRAAGRDVSEPVVRPWGRAVELRDPAGIPLRLVEVAPTDRAERIEAQLTEFIEGQAGLAGAPTEELAARVAAVLAEAQDRIRAVMTGVAHNKVLATQLLVSQQARQVEQGTSEQWRLLAASTLLSDLIVRG
jgi:catechol 2,3-dioxygenase-like lactoylglutathione lyase family enzyme